LNPNTPAGPPALVAPGNDKNGDFLKRNNANIENEPYVNLYSNASSHRSSSMTSLKAQSERRPQTSQKDSKLVNEKSRSEKMSTKREVKTE
jgi:hypothetical protein